MLTTVTTVTHTHTQTHTHTHTHTQILETECAAIIKHDHAICKAQVT